MIHGGWTRCALLALATAVSPWVAAGEPEPDPFAEFEAIADINEGALEFLDRPPAAPYPRQVLRNTLTPASLRTGWIESRQCFHDLDPAAALQVVFRPGRVRGVVIEQTRNIGRAWVEGASVQLEDVGRRALLCLRSENRALYLDADGSVFLGTGPHMRRFLDGYFPMRLELTVRYPPDRLRLDSVKPPAGSGPRLRHRPGELYYEALFQGELRVLVHFLRRDGPAAGAGQAPPHKEAR